MLERHAHVRKRPENYVGNCKLEERVLFAFEPVPEPEPEPAAEPAAESADEDEPMPDDVLVDVVEPAKVAKPRKKPVAWRARVTKVKTPLGFGKIIDEALDNVYDNDTRPDSKQTSASITFPDTVTFKGVGDDALLNSAITVVNNGSGIPIVPYAATEEGSVALEEGTTVVEAIFNNWLSGNNYDDTEERAGGGRNGIGIKATNALSTNFTVNVKDPINGKTFDMTWADGMSKTSKPSIRSRKAKTGGVTVSFVPDFAYFKLPAPDVASGAWDDELQLVVQTRIAELAACLPVSKVKFNGVTHPFCNKFDKLAQAAAKCLGSAKVGKGVKIACGEDSKGSKVAKVGLRAGLTAYVFIRPPGMNEDAVPNLGYVNGIACLGNHVDGVIGAVGSAVREDVAKAMKQNVKGFRISRVALRNAIWVAVRATIPNPEFESQSKTKLTTMTSKFGFKLDASDVSAALKRAGVVKVLANIVKNGISAVESRVADSALNDVSRYSSTAGIDGYDAAGNVGKRGSKCTLILTEGNSAKNLAVAMISTLGRSNYGIKPLRGKGVNCLKTRAHATKNREFIDVCKIMRLRPDMVFTTREEAIAVIPYSKIILMADQDKDGAHIVGLILASFHAIFPSLMRVIPDLFVRFVTPVVRVRVKGTEIPVDFYSEPDFEEWRAGAGVATISKAGTTVKRYKGLGTSTREEALQYAEDMDRHTLQLHYHPTESADALVLAFGDKVDPRRAALEDSTFASESLDYSKQDMSIREYLEGEVWEYHRESVRRGILGEDGNKEVNRKILHVMMAGQKRGKPDKTPGKWVKGDTKVDALASAISMHSHYKYGSKSIEDAVPKMAQDYIGTNNVSLLVPMGQFGSRVGTKDDHSSSRYILSRMNPVARFIYPEMDDPVLVKRMEDAGPAEPVCYSGIINMGMVNGTDLAIGTGYKYTYPMHNPSDVMNCTRAWIDCHDDVAIADLDGVSCEVVETDPSWRDLTMGMVPWYRWFKGTVDAHAETAEKFIVRGVYGISPGTSGTTVITVTELPPGEWTDSWKSMMETKFLIRKTDNGTKNKIAPFIRSIEDLGNDLDVHLRLICDAKAVENIPVHILEGSTCLRLVSTATRGPISITYPADDETCDSVATTYPDMASWMDVWARKRASLYVARIKHQIAEQEFLCFDRTERYRFIKAVVDQELVIRKRPRADIVGDLVRMGMRSDEEVEKRIAAGAGVSESPTFQRLLSMAISSMTAERLAVLAAEIETSEALVSELKAKTVFGTWREDMDLLEGALEVYTKSAEDRWRNAVAKKTKTAKKGRVVKSGK